MHRLATHNVRDDRRTKQHKQKQETKLSLGQPHSRLVISDCC